MRMVFIDDDGYSPNEMVVGETYEVLQFDRDRRNPYFSVTVGDNIYLVPEKSFISLHEWRTQQLKKLDI